MTGLHALFTLESRFRALLWVNAAGLALSSCCGTEIAMIASVSPWVAVRLGVMTATAGGITRDVICDERSLIPRREIYITVPAAVAVNHVCCAWRRYRATPRCLQRSLTGFCIPPAAILRGRSQLRYRIRSARDYPDRR